MARLFTPAELQELNKYRKAKITTVEIAQSRGFDLGTDAKYLTMTQDKFVADPLLSPRPGSLLDYNYLSREYTRDGDLLYIKFAAPSGLATQGVAFADEFIRDVTTRQAAGHKTGIVVVNQKLSPAALEVLSGNFPFRIQVYHIYELQYNVVRHIFAPKYTALNKEEQAKLLEENRLTLKMLPQIKVNDPVARYYGWEVGQVIRRDVTNLILETLSGRSTEFAVVEYVNF